MGRCQHTLTLKKALPDRVPLFDRSQDKATRSRKTIRVFPGGSNDQRDLHGPNTKNPGVAGALAGATPASVVTACEHGDEMKQMNKQIEDVQIKTHRRADVVAFAAINDTAGIK